MLTPSPFPNQGISPHKTHPTLLHTRVNHNTIAIAITYTNKFSPFSPSHTILPRRQQIVNREKVKSRRIKKKKQKTKKWRKFKGPPHPPIKSKVDGFLQREPSTFTRVLAAPLCSPLCPLSQPFIVL
jgi:hypothetical protein